MSTSYTYLDCEQCGYTTALYDQDNWTGEYTYFCQVCGVYDSLQILCEPDPGSPGTERWKRDKRGNPIYQRTSYPGYGVHKVVSPSGRTSFRCWPNHPTEQDIQLVIRAIETTPGIDRNLAAVTVWDAKNNQVVVRYGVLKALLPEEVYGPDGERIAEE